MKKIFFLIVTLVILLTSTSCVGNEQNYKNQEVEAKNANYNKEFNKAREIYQSLFDETGNYAYLIAKNSVGMGNLPNYNGFLVSNIQGDTFFNFSGNEIYKLTSTGTEKIYEISNDDLYSLRWLNLFEDKLYFINESKGRTYINRIDLDGNNKTEVYSTTNYIKKFQFCNNQPIIISESDDYDEIATFENGISTEIHKTETGLEYSSLTSDGENLYFTIDNFTAEENPFENKILKIDTEGNLSEIADISSNILDGYILTQGNKLTYYNDSLYFQLLNEDNYRIGELCSYSLNDNKFSNLISYDSEFFRYGLLDNKMFFAISSDRNSPNQLLIKQKDLENGETIDLVNILLDEDKLQDTPTYENSGINFIDFANNNIFYGFLLDEAPTNNIYNLDSIFGLFRCSFNGTQNELIMGDLYK